MTQLRRPIFWHLLRRADEPWHATEVVREHLRNADAVAGNRPYWHPCAGPIWSPYGEDEWFHADEVMPWFAANIRKHRGHNRPSDNDDGPPSGSVN